MTERAPFIGCIILFVASKLCILYADRYCCPNPSCYVGFGVYLTEADCLNAPFEGSLSRRRLHQASVFSAAIDPNTYHQPEVPGSQCWSMQPKTSQDACPHLWPDVHRWEDASIWPEGRVPPAWSAVILPQNTKVLISGCSLSHQNPFYSITIPWNSEVHPGTQGWWHQCLPHTPAW